MKEEKKEKIRLDGYRECLIYIVIFFLFPGNLPILILRNEGIIA